MGETLVANLDDAIATHPDRVCVIDVDGAESTYRELDLMANGVAAALGKRGVGRGDRVGICRRKSTGTVAALLGVLRTGAAYVPVDIGSPSDRNRRIFEDCGVVAVLLDEADPAVVPPDAAEIVGDPPATGVRPSEPAIHPEDLAYVLYTSGSTGHPKGVCLEHRNATSFVDWCVRTFDASCEDRCSSHAPFHFDLSILDLWMPLSIGGSVVLIDESTARDPRSLPALIAERRVTNWYSVPSILALMTSHGDLESHDHSSLRTVCFAGEVFPLSDLRRLRATWSAPDFWNLYGPTETNVCTAYRVPDGMGLAGTERLPIGQACDHCEVRIVDDAGTRLGSGEVGRIVCRGGPVMRGYWGLDPDRTAAFIEIEGDRWYDTGDLGAFDSKARVHFHGRRDRMVKRHGYRIELGEIEAGLDRADFLVESAVMAESTPAGVVIHAAVRPVSGTRPSIIGLRTHCGKVLPGYMIPDRFHVVDGLPRTATGKVDLPRLRSEVILDS